MKKYIKRVLMCRPTYFTVEYVINPWMKPGAVNRETALKQWEELVAVYQNLEIDVEIIEQRENLPDMVFAADQGIVSGNCVLLSNFHYPQRQGENIPYKAWFTSHGYKVKYIPPVYFFEGNGEALPWQDMLFVGTGFRTTLPACDYIENILGKKVVPIELVDKHFYHLDTCVFPLNNETVFYYPPAVSSDSKKTLEKLVPHLIEFTHDEAQRFCANSVVTDNSVVCQQGSPTFVKKLNELGYKAFEVDASEYMKSGGGIHCLTNILEWA